MIIPFVNNNLTGEFVSYLITKRFDPSNRCIREISSPPCLIYDLNNSDHLAHLSKIWMGI